MRLIQYSQTESALGSEITLAFVSDMTSSEAEQLFRQLWRIIYVFERSFSRFIPASELSLFNKSAGLLVPITPAFKDLLVAAKVMGEKTKGLYNPFILPALQKVGYKKSGVPEYSHDMVDDYSSRRVVAIDKLIITDNQASIPSDTAIDMGGCGKGYLADKLCQILNNKGINNYWMSLGGDIATSGVDENGDYWLIGIQDANDLSMTSDWAIQCPVTPFAIATSGTFRRKGQTSDWDWHHIIDPVTLRPAQTDIRLATVCAHTALEADVLASCAIILGSNNSPLLLKTHGVLSFLLQAESDIQEKQFGDNIIKQSISISNMEQIYA